MAIGARLKKCPQILTLGFKPNFSDYTSKERELLLNTPRILYPTAFYADLFNAMGKPTFPSYHTYKFAMDKIKQTAMFQMMNIPHPRTRIFYGKLSRERILAEFCFPFIAKIPRGSAQGKGVFLIQTPEHLDAHLSLKGPAYIQEYLPFDRDMRIIVMGREAVFSYWRVARGSDFKTNVSRGGEIRFDPLPREALDLARATAQTCGWDDVGIDIALAEGKFYVLEGNMKYGTKGFKKAGIDYKDFLCRMVLEGKV
ncbi:ATP-grasp domain-containing protein [Desulfospira joergensenii]|uniref:ATP-grasp domain-containing protein n=1 Tax=Desulfospira joergensenii TaxID=53329 RepID=UPI001FC9E29F|nr:ATP-grasp domain-containing protein [Desulfospira joergensenii]